MTKKIRVLFLQRRGEWTKKRGRQKPEKGTGRRSVWKRIKKSRWNVKRATETKKPGVRQGWWYCHEGERVLCGKSDTAKPPVREECLPMKNKTVRFCLLSIWTRRRMGEGTDCAGRWFFFSELRKCRHHGKQNGTSCFSWSAAIGSHFSRRCHSAPRSVFSWMRSPRALIFCIMGTIGEVYVSIWQSGKLRRRQEKQTA